MMNVETIKEQQLPLAKRERMRARGRAWNCFFDKQNSLLLIAAILLPAVFLVAGQGIYSMLYMAFDETDIQSSFLTVIDILLIVLTLPLIGGTIYIVTGLAKREARELRDVFYAYTSWHAFARVWSMIILISVVVGAVIGIFFALLGMTQGLLQMAEQANLDALYVQLFSVCGFLLVILVSVLALILSGYLVPFVWLIMAHPEQKIRKTLVQSLTLSHRRLGSWMCLQLSFIGWLLLSVATVGVLLVLFVLPYYLLTVTYYLSPECGEL